MKPTGSVTNSAAPVPRSLANRPGLSSLSYRAGSYATFFQAMKDRISGTDLSNGAAELPLSSLTTRSVSDPAIAILDAWAVTADVLTFYQERIANEGYLRTATERRSILALADLVGYAAKPGVSASVYVAYTLESSSSATIPAASQIQSVPIGTGLPQMFETSQDLAANGAWNVIQPRLTQPQTISDDSTTVFVEGITTNLKPNDPILISAAHRQLHRIATVETQLTQLRTKITLQPKPPEPEGNKEEETLASATQGDTHHERKRLAATTIPDQLVTLSALARTVSLVKPLTMLPAHNPASSEKLSRSVSSSFASKSDIAPAMLKVFFPRASVDVYTALRHTDPTPSAPAEVFALRVQAAPFGSTAPLKPIVTSAGAVIGTEEWPLGGHNSIRIVLDNPSASVDTLERLAGVPQDTKKSSPFTATITLTLGSSSTTADVSVQPAGSKSTPLGGSTVTAAAAPNFENITWTFTNPDRVIKLDFRVQNDGQHIGVTAGASSSPIVVAINQSASAKGSDGSSTVVTNGPRIVIQDTTPGGSITPTLLDLDTTYDQIVPMSWVAIQRADTQTTLVTQVLKTEKLSAVAYNLSARVTRLTLRDPWLTDADTTLASIRSTTVFAQSESLALADEPMQEDVKGSEIELAGIYEGLTSGRWLVVQGTRTDIAGTTGVPAAELVMIGSVKQQLRQKTEATTAPDTASGTDKSAPPPAPQYLPGESIHSFLQLANPLSYTYERSSVSILGNVVQATHGRERSESLGSGDSSQVLQRFSLHQAPLTYLSASTPKGAKTTLSVSVNDITWNEVDTLANAGPSDRSFVTSQDDQDVTSIVFGDGVHGMRLPTGIANVSANYRAGLGAVGNLPSGQLTLLASRPPGVRSVINPIASSGGADRESVDDARTNVPLTITALDRLVSTSDYADFARNFAGISKAMSATLSDGSQRAVCVTIAGADAGAIDKSSELYRNLLSAFRTQGDPYQRLNVEICELMLLIISAKIRILPGYDWDAVSSAIRAELLSAFGFKQQDIGESVPSSRVVSVIQSVVGVQYLHLTTLDTITQQEATSPEEFRQRLVDIATSEGPKTSIQVLPPRYDAALNALAAGQLAFLSGDVPDTLILTEIKA